MNIEERLFQTSQDAFRFFMSEVIDFVGPHCESPIETLLGSTMIVAFSLSLKGRGFRFALPGDELTQPAAAYLWMPQYQWRKYRIDWVFRSNQLAQPYVFVECDGHDFHERTPEQAERDRSKDREIQQAGIPIMRFTGREIYRDSVECCVQIISALSTVGRKAEP